VDGVVDVRQVVLHGCDRLLRYFQVGGDLGALAEKARDYVFVFHEGILNVAGVVFAGRLQAGAE
jgi:hypothetical protein